MSKNRICSVCNKPQFPSPGGWVCENGHGGALGVIGEVPNYQEQYLAWHSKIMTKLRNRVNDLEK